MTIVLNKHLLAPGQWWAIP